MEKNLQKALEEAQKKLEELLPEIEKRQKKATDEALEEPDHLKSGVSIDELEINGQSRSKKMKTSPNKTQMDKALQEAIKRAEDKESQFQSNMIQASCKHKIFRQKSTLEK